MTLRHGLPSPGISTEFEAYGVPPGESAAMVESALRGARGRNFIGATPG
jgi:hypothetical protein